MNRPEYRSKGLVLVTPIGMRFVQALGRQVESPTWMDCALQRQGELF